MTWASILFFFFFITPVWAVECPQGMYLVSEHPRSAYYRDDGTHVSETTVSSYCKNYRSDGPLKIKYQGRIPRAWPFKNEVFRNCTITEQNKITQALNSLPKILTQFGEIKILCAKTSETKDNPATSAPEEKIIVLYNSAFQMDIKRILIHELAHFLYQSLSDKERKQYWNVAQWSDQNLERIPKTQRTLFSAEDGKTDPDEDFSNNVEFFYADPEVMRTRFSSIHHWLLKFLGGKQ